MLHFTLLTTYRREAVRVWRTVSTYREVKTGEGEPRIEKETESKKIFEQKVEQMKVRRPCCVGFICVLVYLAGGVAAAGAAVAAAAGHRPPLRQRLGRFQCRRPDGVVGVLRFCWSVKRRASESVGCVRGCGFGFGSGPRTRKASMCRGYCEISR